MKKLTIMLAFVLASCATLRAQNINVDNSIGRGDLYITGYAYASASCALFINFAQGMIPAGTIGSIDLTLASSWNGGLIPGIAYDINYVTISRDPSCAGSFGWGSPAGPCILGGIAQYDELTLGTTACSYNTQGCLTITFSAPPPATCGGFQVGDVEKIQFTPAGSSCNIDVIP